MVKIFNTLKRKNIRKKILHYWNYFKLWVFVSFSGRYSKYKEADAKTFPIIIISFNQLFYLKKLVSFLKKSGYLNIIIIDNNSSYTPLLSYFEEIKNEVIIHRLNYNYGHKVFWNQDYFFRIYGKGYYVVTDADIVPNSDCPTNFLSKFKEALYKNKEVTKVGFSLLIDDIPSKNQHREKIINWEQKFWKIKDLDGNYIADIDTTFAIYRPLEREAILNRFYKGIRMKPPFVAMHGGWHIDPNNLTTEQKYYMQHANGSSSWRLDENGNIIDPKYL